MTMPAYRRGSRGEEVERIQRRLKELALYRGPIDGDFGGGTESAVRAFQARSGLEADGIVGPQTWTCLFVESTIPAPALLDRPLGYRALALTGTFETSAHPPDCFACVTGDFDGQGLSFGALQWNLGQDTLQPLLHLMDQRHRDVLVEIFHEHYPVLVAMLQATRAEQLAWARSIQDPRHRLIEPWSGLFKALGRRDEFQSIQAEAAQRFYRDALALCEVYGVHSERAFALMFDIRVQNGSISPLVRTQIERDVARLEPGADEVARLRIIANRRAEAASAAWVEDVRARKLTIANGEGTVHGRHYQLEEQYGIGLKPASP
jgi:hypothetical protein